MSQDPFDLIREWFAAYNREELDSLESLYEPTASLEQDKALTQSRDGIRTVLARYFAEWQPAFEAAIRRPRARDRADRERHDPRRVDRARAAQRGQCRSRAPRLLAISSIESGTIQMQREVAVAGALPTEDPPPPAEARRRRAGILRVPWSASAR